MYNNDMNFFKRFIHNFSAAEVDKGKAYYRGGKVSIAFHSPSILAAQIEGSKTYQTIFNWNPELANPTIYSFCSCPCFDDFGRCKHLAALMLAADSPQVDLSIAGGQPLKLYAVELEEIELDGSTLSALRSYEEGESDLHKDPRGGALDNTPSQANRYTQLNSRAEANNWQLKLQKLTSLAPSQPRVQAGRASEQFWYHIDLRQSSADQGRLWISLYTLSDQDGRSAKGPQFKPKSLRTGDLEQYADSPDYAILELLLGNSRLSQEDMRYGFQKASYTNYQSFSVLPAVYAPLLSLLSSTGRFGVLLPNHIVPPPGIKPLLRIPETNSHFLALNFSGPDPWELEWQVAADEAVDTWNLHPRLLHPVLGSRHFTESLTVSRQKYVIFYDQIGMLHADAIDLAWSKNIGNDPILIPKDRGPELIQLLAQAKELPARLKLPDELAWQSQQLKPIRNRLTIRENPLANMQAELEAELSFEYADNQIVVFDSGNSSWLDSQSNTLYQRDLAAENAALLQLVEFGAVVKPANFPKQSQGHCYLYTSQLAELVEKLDALGWQIEALGSLIRSAGSFSLSVKSGIDWFEMLGEYEFGDQTASLPELLESIRSGSRFVRLGDGTQGLLPEDWLARFTPFQELGEIHGDALRFKPSQTMLLDALLAAQPVEQLDLATEFKRLRTALQKSSTIGAKKEPRTFQGTLRSYQREGLGWLKYLESIGFGGCLADDMGLGKTIQILALLEAKRLEHEKGSKKTGQSPTSSRPSLLVAPRSLIFNWVQEAARFTPGLKVLDFTGKDRKNQANDLDQYDLVITTYGTLRLDITWLCEHRFHYAILDEAQAIKNASSQSAKACRLIQADHRLALTGTPIENHLGELWSLFEFLNPGMLGTNQRLTNLMTSAARPVVASPGSSKPHTPEVSGTALLPAENSPTRSDKNNTFTSETTLLGRALRPFILRRTKQQVLPELPEKSEQTLYCEFNKTQQAQYNQLRDHYRNALLNRIDEVGVNKSKIQVLEALLRLRQAACHPGLIDAQKRNATSAKLDVLFEQLKDVLESGHKALIFSQFTTFLDIVRRQLDKKKIIYEYLDGQTSNRQARVERFQTDPDCKLFLISLKAGGQGLNLTAADYVFILDPWWNPAAEAQAIDRAHRMGQQQHVFAYRLIVRDTVEEKILQLQEHKRNLADAILNENNSLIQSLTTEDLELLLS